VVANNTAIVPHTALYEDRGSVARGTKMTELPINTPLGKLELQRVVEYYDFPRIFTCKNSTGQIYFAISTYDDAEEFHWIYLPISSLRLSAIFAGATSLRQSVLEPEGGFLFFVRTFTNGRTEFSYALPEQISDEDLPDDGYVINIQDEPNSRSATIDPKMVAQASKRETFNYRIFPDEPTMHEIASRKLGGILTSTQELLDALGQSSNGQPSVRGPISAEILEKTRVNVAHVFEGSFGVQFRASQFSDLLDQSLISSAISEFSNVITAADSEDLLSNKLHSLKGRVASKYRRLLKELSDINSGLELNWGAVQHDRGGIFSLTKEQVRKAYAIVDKIDIEMADEVVVSGKLVGFNSRALRYEIQSAEDDKSYSGKVADDAVIDVMNPAIGEYYSAKLRMLVETQSTSGDELIRWVLVNLSHRNSAQKT
jgi:hypothetical protein